MKNINNKTIIWNLVFMAFLALGVLFTPALASADYNYVFSTPGNIGSTSFPAYNGYNGAPYGGNPYGYTNTYAPGYSAPATNTQAYNYVETKPATTATTTKTVTKKTTPATTVATVGTGAPSGNLNGYMLVPIPNNTANTQTASADPLVGKVSALTAGVVFGTASFIPNGLLGWVMIAILILLIIILVRRVFGGTQRYMKVPLKHA